MNKRPVMLMLLDGSGITPEHKARGLQHVFVHAITDGHDTPPDSGQQFVAQLAVTFNDGDGVLFFNFQADRMRQITRAQTDPALTTFKRWAPPKLGGAVCMARYDGGFALPLAYPPEHLADILGETLSRQGLRQLHIAETEKYTHVTYFLTAARRNRSPAKTAA